MPILKNRLVVEVAKNLNALFHLEIGLVRGPLPSFEQMFHRSQRQLRDSNRRVQFVREELSETQDLLSRERRLLAETNGRLSRAREQLQRKEQALQERDREVSWPPLPEAQRSPDAGTEGQLDGALYAETSGILERIPVDLGGGCSVDKAYVLAALIRRHGLKTTADVGVYRGRSLFPQALAHGRFTGGVVYGVDPYSVEEAREEDPVFEDGEHQEELDRFIEETDWEGLYEEVRALNEDLGYSGHCKLLRKTSAGAAAYFRETGISLDLVHIDGNHDTGKVTEDAESYAGILRSGGFIVLDDISFASVRPAYELLRSRLRLVLERADADHSNDYAIFQNATPSAESGYNRRLWLDDLW